VDFEEEMIQIPDVLEYESAHDSIEGSVLEWKTILEIVKNKLHRVGPGLQARLRQHSLGEIKSRNDCTRPAPHSGSGQGGAARCPAGSS